MQQRDGGRLRERGPTAKAMTARCTASPPAWRSGEKRGGSHRPVRPSRRLKVLHHFENARQIQADASSKYTSNVTNTRDAAGTHPIWSPPPEEPEARRGQHRTRPAANTIPWCARRRMFLRLFDQAIALIDRTGRRTASIQESSRQQREERRRERRRELRGAAASAAAGSSGGTARTCELGGNFSGR